MYFPGDSSSLNYTRQMPENMNCQSRVCRMKKKRQQYQEPDAYEPPRFQPCLHRYFRTELVERECLTSEQYVDMLSTPKAHPWLEAVHENAEKNSRKLKKKKYMRQEEPKQELRCVDFAEEFINDMWNVMTPDVADRLIDLLVTEFGMTVDEAEDFIDCKSTFGRPTPCVKKQSKAISNLGPKHKWVSKFSDVFASRIEQNIVNLLMAKKSPMIKRLAERILKDICNVTGDVTSMQYPKSKRERTWVLVATYLAFWFEDIIKDLDKPQEEKPLVSEEEEESEKKEPEERNEDEEESDKGDEKEEDPTKTEEEIAYESDAEKPDETTEKNHEANTQEDPSEKEKEPAKGEEIEEEKSRKEEVAAEENPAQKENPAQNEEPTEQEKAQEEQPPLVKPAEEEQPVEEERAEQPSKQEETSNEQEQPKEEDKTREEETSKEGDTSKEEETPKKEETPTEEEKLQEEDTPKEDEKLKEEGNPKEEGTPKEEGEPKEEEVVTNQEEKQSEEKTEEAVLEDVPTEKETVGGKSEDKVPAVEEEVNKSEDQSTAKKESDERFPEEGLKDEEKPDRKTLSEKELDKLGSLPISSSERSPVAITQKPAFEIRLNTESTLHVQKISYGTVVEQTAQARRVQAPPRRRVPESESPLNLKSAEEWVNWASSIANIGDEWGKWLDKRLTEGEKQLADKRKHSDWKAWLAQTGTEALKWRVEKERIKDEGKLWDRKLNEHPKDKSETVVNTTDLD